jgi:hypothetical protein
MYAGITKMSETGLVSAHVWPTQPGEGREAQMKQYPCALQKYVILPWHTKEGTHQLSLEDSSGSWVTLKTYGPQFQWDHISISTQHIVGGQWLPAGLLMT